MIVEFVTFPTPAGWSREQMLEDAKHTIPKWTANQDLLRKHFARGIGDNEGDMAGIYVWPSVEAAKMAHDDAWREAVKKRCGSYPTIRYFDLFLLIDNEHDRVTEWGENGQPRQLETA
jgi:hypothetical protein